MCFIRWRSFSLLPVQIVSSMCSHRVYAGLAGWLRAPLLHAHAVFARCWAVMASMLGKLSYVFHSLALVLVASCSNRVLNVLTSCVCRAGWLASGPPPSRTRRLRALLGCDGQHAR